MSVARADLNACIGCRTCVNICPMDVFYFDEEAQKSVILYPENCQSCGQCYLNCQGDSLAMTLNMYQFSITSGRGLKTFPEVTAEHPSESKSW